MDRWWQRPWLRFHATIAPFGISATTLQLTLYLEQWQWQGRDCWELAGDLVDLGAALYGMAAVLGERGDCIYAMGIGQTPGMARKDAGRSPG